MLSLNSCKLNPKGNKAIMNRIKIKSSLKSFHIANTNFTNEEILEILDICLIHEGLETIDISGIKDLGAPGEAKESFLVKATFLQIKTLVFKDNRLNKDYLKNFAENVFSDKLECLDISNNSIGDIDFDQVLSIIGKLNGLQKLYLNNNLLTRLSVEKLISFYKENKSGLRKLSINSNKLETSGAARIILNLHVLNGIEMIDINNNHILVRELHNIISKEKFKLEARVNIQMFQSAFDIFTRRDFTSLSDKLLFT
jgi:Leucine-rich repeat (LRR) protein